MVISGAGAAFREGGSRRHAWQRPLCWARGARGGSSGPGVSPKSLFRLHMGAGLRKWRGSQISEGQGRGGEGRMGPLPAGAAPLHRPWTLPPPPAPLQTFLGTNFPAPASRAAARWTGGPGEYRPATQRREGGRQPWTPPTVPRPRRRAGGGENGADLDALRSASRLQRSSLSRAPRRQRLRGCLHCYPTVRSPWP